MPAHEHIRREQVEMADHTQKTGYRSDHGKWWDLEGHRDVELERGNDFPDISKYPGHEAIWVTHSEEEAKRYGDIIHEVDLTGATKFHTDDEGGYVYVRPKTR